MKDFYILLYALCIFKVLNILLLIIERADDVNMNSTMRGETAVTYFLRLLKANISSHLIFRRNNSSLRFNNTIIVFTGSVIC